MNRESGFFQNTRIYYDVFHSYNYTCSPVYRTSHVQGLEGVNTSICEQLNSYLQKVKVSARKMTHEHFMFHIQFFIHMWNISKGQSLDKQRVHVEVAGVAV